VEKELAAIEKLHDEATVRNRVTALNIEIAKVNATVTFAICIPWWRLGKSRDRACPSAGEPGYAEGPRRARDRGDLIGCRWRLSLRLRSVTSEPVDGCFAERLIDRAPGYNQTAHYDL
jgi:hypothetical protein